MKKNQSYIKKHSARKECSSDSDDKATFDQMLSRKVIPKKKQKEIIFHYFSIMFNIIAVCPLIYAIFYYKPPSGMGGMFAGLYWIILAMIPYGLSIISLFMTKSNIFKIKILSTNIFFIT